MRPRIKEWKGDHLPYAHIKYDGIFCHIRKNEFGSVKAYSKLGNELALDFMPTMLNVATLVPTGTDLLGELWYPGQPASYVKSAIAKEDKDLQFLVFAANIKSPRLEDLSDACVKWALCMSEFYTTHDSYAYSRLGKFKPGETPPIRQEGFVFKSGIWDDWQRWKPMKTIDLIVTDVEPGKGKYTGLVGSLVCSSYEGRELCNVSGFTDDERYELSEDDIGRVIEVKYQYVAAKGRLRHATFVRFRDDKLPEQCTEDQDEDLATTEEDR